MLFAFVAKGACRQQHKQWSQPFAATRHDVLRYLRDERDIAFKACRDEAINGRHIITRKGDDAFESQGIRGFFHRVHKNSNDA